jgi:hypothetical protein
MSETVNLTIPYAMQEGYYGDDFTRAVSNVPTQRPALPDEVEDWLDEEMPDAFWLFDQGAYFDRRGSYVNGTPTLQCSPENAVRFKLRWAEYFEQDRRGF